ncbi:MAG: hypothetical protein AAB341_04500 [Planctomycetota bacterium]
MTIINGHFDGKRVVFDEPVPPDIAPDTPVRVFFGDGQAREVLAELAKPARPGDLPRDFSEQHEHYVKGTPRN